MSRRAPGDVSISRDVKTSAPHSGRSPGSSWPSARADGERVAFPSRADLVGHQTVA